MIVSTLPELIEHKEEINLPSLYQTYLLQEIRRQKILKHRALLLSDQVRLNLLQSLAVDLYAGTISEISFQETLHLIETTLQVPRQEAEYYAREFLTTSFLVRKRDSYFFSHKSILEYLVAQHIAGELQTVMPDVFARVPLHPVVVDFLIELKPDTKTLWKWMGLSKNPTGTDSPYLGGNAATVLCKLSHTALRDADLSGCNLTKADLSDTDLRGATFDSTVLQDIKMERARFRKEDLSKALISDVVITFCFKFSKEESADLNKFFNKYRFSRGSTVQLTDLYDPSGTLKLLTMKVKNLAEAEVARHDLMTYLLKPIALYYDEYVDLVGPEVFQRLENTLASSLRFTVRGTAKR